MHITRFNPRRAARAGTQVGGSAAVFGTFILWNNSQSADLLVVRQWQMSPGGSNVIGFFNTTTTLSLTLNNVTGLVPNDTPPPGQLYVGTTATQPTAIYEVFNPSSSSVNWTSIFPFAVIPPNQGLGVQILTANVAFVFSIMWEAMRPEELFAEAYSAQLENLALNDLP